MNEWVRHRGLIACGLVLVTSIAVYLLAQPGEQQPSPTANVPAVPPADVSIEREKGGSSTMQTKVKRETILPERPAIRRVDPPTASDPSLRSPLADKLNAPGTSASGDIAVVYDLFAEYRKRFGGFPTGEDNASFVNALTGNNPQRLAILDRSHPSINAEGELVDRWGKPFFVHLESRDAMEVRSAGPDAELYTADDLVKTSPSLNFGPPERPTL